LTIKKNYDIIYIEKRDDMKRTDKAIFMEQDEFKNLTKTFSKE